MSGRKIFIAYDHSKFSEYAVSWILDHSILQQSDKVIVGTVVDEEPSKVFDPLILQAAIASGGEWLAEDYKRRVGELEKDASGILKKVEAQIKEKGFTVETILLSGNVQESIIDYTENNSIDLIVIGSRGIGFFKRAVLGSVSDHIIHHSKTSVLLVRGAEERK